MGAVTSFCCGHEDNPIRQSNPHPTSTSKRNIPKEPQKPSQSPCGSDTQDPQQQPEQPKTQKEITQQSSRQPKLDKDPPPKPEKNSFFEQLQKIYPLPPDKKIKWNSFEVTHRIGGGGFGEVFLAELK